MTEDPNSSRFIQLAKSHQEKKLKLVSFELPSDLWHNCFLLKPTRPSRRGNIQLIFLRKTNETRHSLRVGTCLLIVVRKRWLQTSWSKVISFHLFLDRCLATDLYAIIHIYREMVYHKPSFLIGWETQSKEISQFLEIFFGSHNNIYIIIILFMYLCFVCKYVIKNEVY
jgi:hypothetical protein